MAKTTGLGWTTLSVDNDAGVAKDLRNDVNSFDFTTPYAEWEVTGVDLSAKERLLLLADLTGTLNGIFNPSTDKIHAVLGAGNLRVVRTVLMVVAAKSLTSECLFTSYKLSRASGGELTTESPYALADGVTPTWT